MKCPNCHKTGNTFQRIFMRKKGHKNRYCIYCNTEVKLFYNWKKIGFLSIGVFGGLIILNTLIIYLGWPGINGGFAGGIGGSLIAIYMRRPPFLKIELANPANEKMKK